MNQYLCVALTLCRRTIVLALGVFICGEVGHANDWPSWRGLSADGITGETGFATEWSADKNVRWRLPLPEGGNSTPVVFGERIFVTQPMQQGKRRTVLCVDRQTGRQLWQSGVDAVELERTHKTNPYCSPSPATDGRRVVAWFGSNGLVAFDMEGNQLWQRPLGKVDHIFGYGSSPIIHANLCFLNFGPGTREIAFAVDMETGNIVWEHKAPGPAEPPEINEQGEPEDFGGTWSSPIIADSQLIHCFRGEVTALEPQSGRVLWTCQGLGPQMKASPVAGEGVVVALGGKDSSTLGIRLGGSGDITETHLLWRKAKAMSRMGTGVIYQGHLYVNRRNGIFECIELLTGEKVWEKRLQVPGHENDTWSSPILAGDTIYTINQSADVFVLRASPTFELLATNSLNEYTNSSVVASQGDLFIRTHESLWCIGSP